MIARAAIISGMPRFITDLADAEFENSVDIQTSAGHFSDNPWPFEAGNCFHASIYDRPGHRRVLHDTAIGMCRHRVRYSLEIPRFYLSIFLRYPAFTAIFPTPTGCNRCMNSLFTQMTITTPFRRHFSHVPVTFTSVADNNPRADIQTSP